MSSQKLSNNYLMTYSSTINNTRNKTRRINIFPQSKPTFLNGSKISKMINSFKDESLHKKCITSLNSFFEKNDVNKIHNGKAKHIYVQKNHDKNFSDINDNKENINLNSQFRKISNEIINESKYKKIKPNNANKIKKENTNLFSKKYNIFELKKINESIHNSTNIQKDNKNIDIIKSGISELSSLKKVIFENNIFKNIKFFKKIGKTRNNNNSLDKSNNINTMNYISSRLNRHYKTKTEDINKNCFTDRNRIYNYINTKVKSKPKKINRKFKINISYNNNNYTNNNSITSEEKYNKSNFMLPKQSSREEENYSKENILLDNNKTYNEIKFGKNRLKNEIIFDKNKLIEKIKKGKITFSNIEPKYKKVNRINRQINLNITPILKKEKFSLKRKLFKYTKKVIKIDSCTVPGISPLTNSQKLNQDNYLVEKEFLKLKKHFFLEISSGHGTSGHLISKYICNILPTKINNLTEENIKQSFLLTNKLLLNKTNIDCSLSGASLSTIIITPEKIISANVGNCKGVLAIVENGQYSAVDLTKDHNINDINEMKRIMNNGGEIKNGDKIYIKNCDIPGIDTTRSFGDKLGIGIGIWDYPYIKCHYFKGNEKFILLASDGIWKFIDSEESVKIIKTFYENGMDANGALNTLVREAIFRWKNEKNYVEDITCILLFFD